MDFLNNIEDIIIRDDEITLFEAGKNGYYAYLRNGDRIDIMHVFNFQPPIENFDDYYSFMFVESLQGFFVLRQHVIENNPRSWRVYLELKPREACRFFQDAWRLVCSIRKQLSGQKENYEHAQSDE